MTFRFIYCILLSMFVVGCSSRAMDIDKASGVNITNSTSETQRKNRRVSARINNSRQLQKPHVSRPQIFPGTGKFWSSETNAGQSVQQKVSFGNDNKVTLNLVKVPIAQAAKSIFSDILRAPYVVGPGVTGTITLQTAKPVSVRDVLDVFEVGLRSAGASVVKSGTGAYEIVSASEVYSSSIPLKIRSSDYQASGIGQGVLAVPLKFVSAEEMKTLLSPVSDGKTILHTDPTRNIIYLLGSQSQLRSLVDVIDTFDVDWLRGMSFALIPVQVSDPAILTKELETIFSSGQAKTSKGVIKFVPNKRLKSILVITSQSTYLRRARTWIQRLNAAAVATNRQMFIYKIQNRNATELAKLLQSVFSTQTQILKSSPVAPRAQPVKLKSGKGDFMKKQVREQALPIPVEIENSPAEQLKVIADEPNNSLLILATTQEYQKILAMLRTIDAIPNQVLIEATIAEITLTDELKFGIKWFFKKNRSNFTFTDSAAGAISSVFPGFSYAFQAANTRVVLDALASVTDVDVISSPTLMVLDNRKAVLQVGDQVPILTRTAVDTSNPNAPIVNSVKLHDTGIILTVIPRVSDSGRVTLEIEQEVSSVVKTTTSGVDSPTIQQRKVKTTVVVNDGQSLALGGLIQQTTKKSRTKIPLLGDIPFLGAAFRSNDDQIKRTELLILITPHVVRDLAEAGRVTEEFRRQLKLVTGQIKRKRFTPQRTIRRIVE